MFEELNNFMHNAIRAKLKLMRKQTINALNLLKNI